MLQFRQALNPSGNAAASQIRAMDLPEYLQLSLVGAPSIFAKPTCKDKTFSPPFTLRVTVASSQPLKFATAVTAYTLQKEQVHFDSRSH